MTTQRRATNGTFSGTGQSDPVFGKNLHVRMTFAGTATVTIEQLDPSSGSWITVESYTATPDPNPVIAEDILEFSWRLNCTAYTNDVTYTMIATP